MSAITKPDALRASVDAAQAEHDAMARNRASERRPSGVAPKPEPPHTRAAFVATGLAQRVTAARADLSAAHNLVRWASKADKPAFRKRVQTAATALAEAEAAVTAEDRGEPLAPGVQRREQVLPSGTVLREPRVVVTQGRAELQPALERLHRRGTLSKRHYHAARWYRSAWERAGRDAYPIGLGGDGGRSAPQSGNRRIEDAVGSSADLDDARRCIGVFGTAMVEHIVVQGLTLTSYAELHGRAQEECTGILVMVLERLAEHRDGMLAMLENLGLDG